MEYKVAASISNLASSAYPSAAVAGVTPSSTLMVQEESTQTTVSRASPVSTGDENNHSVPTIAPVSDGTYARWCSVPVNSNPMPVSGRSLSTLYIAASVGTDTVPSPGTVTSVASAQSDPSQALMVAVASPL